MASVQETSSQNLSLWLMPSSSSNFYKCMDTFINTTLPTKHFDHDEPPHQQFPPHVTLTSGFSLDSATSDNSAHAQAWLDALPLPPNLRKEHNEAIIEFVALETGDRYFQKLFLRAAKDENLCHVASAARVYSRSSSAQDETDAEKWARDEYQPHLSLYYGDIAQSALERRMAKIDLALGFEIGGMFSCCGGTLSLGARLALVDTSDKQETSKWTILAERELPWVVWKMKHGLF